MFATTILSCSIINDIRLMSTESYDLFVESHFYHNFAHGYGIVDCLQLDAPENTLARVLLVQSLGSVDPFSDDTH